MQALNHEYFLCHNNSKISDTSQWKAVHIHNCSLGDKGLQMIVSCFVKKDGTLYNQAALRNINISQCRLTKFSIDTIFFLLKGCVIKNLIISDDSVSNTSLSGAISNKLFVKNKMFNFKY